MKDIFLLTGATGFIGSFLLTAMIKRGDAVVVVTRENSNLSRISEIANHPNVFIIHDSAAEIKTAIIRHKVSCVLHLAARYIKRHQTVAELEDLLQSNLVFPAKILEIMKETGVKKIITAGSFFEYDLAKKITLTEQSDIKPYNLYALTKVLFQAMVNQYVENEGFKNVHLRLFAPYGPKDNEKLISFLIKSFINKTPVHLTPSEQQWNFTYVDDIVEAFLLAIDYCNKQKNDAEVFNIGQPTAVSIHAIVAELEALLGVKNLVVYDKPYPPDEIFYAACDGIKARDLLGWQAKTSISAGLKKTVAYFNN